MLAKEECFFIFHVNRYKLKKIATPGSGYKYS